MTNLTIDPWPPQVLPQVLHAPPYDFGAILIGCAFLSILVGSVIGKLAGGVLSDRTVTFFARRAARKGDGIERREPEYRLYAMILPVLLMLPALVLFGVGWAQRMSWWVPIVFGTGLYYISNEGVAFDCLQQLRTRRLTVPSPFAPTGRNSLYRADIRCRGRRASSSVVCTAVQLL